MEESGAGRRKYPKKAKCNECRIKSYDKTIIVMDSTHQAITNFFQNNKLVKISLFHGNIGNFFRNRSSCGNGNSGIRFGKSRRIIDSVSYHDNLSTLLMFFLNKSCLILRKYFRIELVYTDLLCYRLCRVLIVPGHHNNLIDA